MTFLIVVIYFYGLGMRPEAYAAQPPTAVACEQSRAELVAKLSADPRVSGVAAQCVTLAEPKKT